MIIECPACHTKFSIDGQLVREIEDPRFHCSRCGQYFQQSKDPQGADTEPRAEATEQKQWQVDHTNVESVLTKEPLHGEQLALIPDPPAATSITVPQDYSAEVEPLVANLDDLPFARTVSPDEDFDPFFQNDWSESRAESWSTSPDSDLAESSEPMPALATEGNDGNPFADDFGDLLNSTNDLEQAPEQSPDGPRTFDPQTGSALEAEGTLDVSSPGVGGGAHPTQVDRSERSTESTVGLAASIAPAGSITPGAGSTTLSLEPVAGAAISGAQYSSRMQHVNVPSEDDSSTDSLVLPHAGLSPTAFSNQSPRPRVPSAMINAEPNEVGSVKRMLGNIEERKTELRRATLARRQEAARQLDKEERRAQKRAEQHERYLDPIRDTPAANWVGVDDRTWLQESNSALSNAPVLLAASVPLLCMLCFSIVAADISLLPSAVRTAFQLNADQLPKLPPPGLEVTNLQSQVISLHDGNKVLEVRGEIINATLGEYKDVRVEAVLYDGENTQIRQRVVDVSSGLLEARLPALHSDAIEELQEPQELEGLTVAPHQKAPFRVVFTDLSGKERWLASRVFSVKRG